MEAMKKQEGKEEANLASALTDEDLKVVRGGTNGRDTMRVCPKCKQEFLAGEWEKHVAECTVTPKPGAGSRWVF